MDITIKDGIISITVDSGIVDKLYIDTLDNVKNMYSDNDDDHSYTVTDFERSSNTITVDSTALSPELDTSAFIITVGALQGFYYDDKELYNKEIEVLTEYCSTCLDKHQKERMVLFMVKYNLLQYAIANDLVEDQINYYIDLARMLGIDFKYKAQCMCSGKCKRCVKCCNGCCSIC